MKEEMGLRKYIVAILYDIRGDNEYPADEIIQANASLLLFRFKNEMREIIGEDETPESYEPKALTETELSLAHHAVQFHARNALRKEQKERADL